MFAEPKVGSPKAESPFSYQAILSSLSDAEIISLSPSLSISAAKTETAPAALVDIVRTVKLGSAAPLFSYQAI